MDYRSKKEVVYDILHEEIISGKIEPGSRLVIDMIASRLKVSQIPIREAIRQLEADGFVTSEPHVGATVTEIDVNFIFEVFALLESMEIICSRTACQMMSDEDLARLKRMIDEMDQSTDLPDVWARQNKAFHLFICECADTQLVLKMLKRVFDHWDRLRLHYLQDVSAKHIPRAQAEHKVLLEALKSRDPVKVEGVIHDHNQSALSSYIHHLQVQGYLVTPEDQ